MFLFSTLQHKISTSIWPGVTVNPISVSSSIAELQTCQMIRDLRSYQSRKWQPGIIFQFYVGHLLPCTIPSS